MRIIYPIERDNKEKAKECIEYLIYSILPQAGSILINANTDCLIEVFWSEDMCGKTTYHAKFVKKPAEMKWSRAKYIGISTSNIRDICAFVMWVNTENNPERIIRKKTTAKVKRHIEETEYC